MRVAGVAVCAAALGAAAAARAQVPAAALDAPFGARPAALGRAYTALADDAYAPVWNPAGLAVLSSPQAAWIYASGPAAERRHGAALALPLGARQGAGLSADTGGASSSFGLSYALSAGGPASFGASARYVDDGVTRGYGADLGYLYRFDDRLSAAVVAGGVGRGDPQTRLASSYVIGRRLAYALEGVFSRGGRSGLRTGLELSGLGLLRARVGVDTTLTDSSLLGLTAGVGLGWGGHGIDLAYIPQGSRSMEQLTLVLSFGASHRSAVRQSVSSDAKPARVSPPAVRTVSFHLEPSSAPFSGFLSNPPDADWAKPKMPVIPAKPDTQEPVQPGMIWLQ
jgi:hypothetical protein